jgi:hypothetical protein
MWNMQFFNDLSVLEKAKQGTPVVRSGHVDYSTITAPKIRGKVSFMLFFQALCLA